MGQQIDIQCLQEGQRLHTGVETVRPRGRPPLAVTGAGFAGRKKWCASALLPLARLAIHLQPNCGAVPTTPWHDTQQTDAVPHALSIIDRL
jgi:hypothetical protein